ncbi:MAG: tetratricopeptide repeat protein [Halioglobus sp.]|nr:tetratricopeptide repeat protein [Halioglobus sp.]
MSRVPVITLTCALLTACAAQTPSPIASQDEDVAPADTTTKQVTERAIPPDSLYPLLLAEFALRQRAYDVALNQYMQQSQLLRDPALSAHTTHLSQFLQRDEEALRSAQLWVELDPAGIEANHTLAEMLIRRGRNAEAVPLLEAVQRAGANANFPALVSGYSRMTPGQRAALEQSLDGLSAEFPYNTGLLLALALIDAENQNYTDALKQLDTLFAREPEQPQALLLEARILIETRARDPYARLEAVLEDNPDAKMLRLQYAGLLTATDMQAARAQFEILLQQAPEDPDLLFSLALINREIGNSEAASDYLLRSIELGQRRSEAYYYLGRIAEERGHTAQAIAYYSKVAHGNEYLAACSRVGQILIAQSKWQRLASWFDEQRTTQPESRAQLYGLEAELLSQADQYDKAMAVYDQAIEELPENIPLRYARAMLYDKRGDLASMEQDLRSILATDPDNATALNALGYTLADRTTRYNEAMQLISRALELRPNEPAILDSMGWVLFRTGRYTASINYLQRAYLAFPDPEVAAHLGEVLWTQGDIEAARNVWREALRRDPGHPLLIGTLKRLGVDAVSLSAGEN